MARAGPRPTRASTKHARSWRIGLANRREGRWVDVDPQGASRKPRDRGWLHRSEGTLFQLVLALLICLAVAIFAVDNDHAVHLRFMGAQFPGIGLPVLLFAVLLLGAVVAAALGGPSLIRLRRETRRLRRQLEAQAQAIAVPSRVETGEGSPAMDAENAPQEGGHAPGDTAPQGASASESGGGRS